MFTPQEIQEKTFVKAVFGGYDMQTVDEFLEPLTEDYIFLYKENAVLKSKMKILVEKLEEYRSQEQNMNKAILTAQRTAEAMIAEAEKKSARIVGDAHVQAETKSSYAAELADQEEARLNSMKEATKTFVENMEKTIRSHMELLEQLKNQDLSVKNQVRTAPRQKPFDYEQELGTPLVVPKTESTAINAQEIADEIEQNIGRLMDMDEPVEMDAGRNTSMDGNTIKFNNLQFGPGYNPTNG